MRKTWVATAVAACFIPAIAMAAPARPVAVIDAYYVIPEIESDDVFVEGDFFDAELKDGDGFGVKGRFDLTPTLFLAGEYQANDYDEFEIDGLGTAEIESELDFIRAGMGLRFGEDSPFYGYAEAVNAELTIDGEGDDETGFGVHLGVDAPVADALSLYGQIGYVDIDDTDGFEFLGGAAFMFTPVFGAFADYRHTELEGDDDIKLTISDIRLGIRIALQ